MYWSAYNTRTQARCVCLDVADTGGMMMVMGEAFNKDGRVDEHGPGSCPICRGAISFEVDARMREAASAEPVARMSLEEFLAWLDQIEATSSRQEECRELG